MASLPYPPCSSPSTIVPSLCLPRLLQYRIHATTSHSNKENASSGTAWTSYMHRLPAYVEMRETSFMDLMTRVATRGLSPSDALCSRLPQLHNRDFQV